MPLFPLQSMSPMLGLSSTEHVIGSREIKVHLPRILRLNGVIFRSITTKI
jgi:hypothetical protein